MAVLQPHEIAPHVFGIPRPVAGDVGYLVPIRIVWIDEDHRIVSGAAAQRSSTGIEDSVNGDVAICFAVFRIFLLHLVRDVVPDKKVPPHRVIFAGEAVERRDVVIIGQTVDARLIVIGTPKLPRITAGLQQKHRPPAFGQACRECSTAGARADNDVIERAAVAHWDLFGRCVAGDDGGR